MHRALALATAFALLGCCAGSARADVLELTDGTKLDGRVFKEEGGFVWVKTLQRVEKIAADRIKSREPGESAVEKYEKLKVAAEKEPITAAALWSLYEFQAAHLKELPPEVAKQNERLLPRILKKEPDHVGAREASGEVMFQGNWVKKSDIARLQAEAAREKLRVEWQTRLGVPIAIYESDSFLLVDNTGDKDLAARGKTLDQAHETLTRVMGVERLWKDRCVIVTIKDYDPYCKALDGFVGEMNIPANIVAAAKDRGTGGLWRHSPYAFQIRWPSSGTESMWSAIVHNSAHVAVWTFWYSTGGRGWERDTPPAWIEEGLGAWIEIEVMGQQVATCMGESRKTSESKQGGTTDKDPRKKKDPKKNAASLREAANEFKERCKAAVESDEFPPMRQFLNYKVGDLGPPEEGGVLGLIVWLLQTDAEKFKAVLAGLAKGGKKVIDEYWRETYGFEVVEDMEKKWRTWVLAEW
jgi:hypothetical protein